jgi:nicotinamidase/pyrazinamidase
MKKSSLIFWNVDTQNDFVEPWGKLFVPGAEQLKPVWAGLTKLASRQKIRVISTADYHYIYSAEIDEKPDMMSTFPPHCLVGTKGAEFVAETVPWQPVIFEWNVDYDQMAFQVELEKYRNIVIRKDAFDVFAGNRVTAPLIDFLQPEIVVVYGVTTNVCVDFAVEGLVKRVKNVYVVSDAIKELPNIPMPLSKWEKAGVHLITSNELEESLKVLKH